MDRGTSKAIGWAPSPLIVKKTGRATTWKAQTQKSFGGDIFLSKEKVSQYVRPMDRIMISIYNYIDYIDIILCIII